MREELWGVVEDGVLIVSGDEVEGGSPAAVMSAEVEGLEDGTGAISEFEGPSQRLGEDEGFAEEDTDSELLGAGGMGGTEGRSTVTWELESDASERTGVLFFLCFDRGDG